jgi:hypothetical protein
MRTITKAIGITVLVSCSSGCLNPAFPALHQVQGAVTLDGEPVKGGSVRFVPSAGDSKFIFRAPVGLDGSYILTTSRASGPRSEIHPGAPTGQYSVTYTPIMRADGTDQLHPIRLPTVVTVKAGDNDIPIQLRTK